ncbi:MAG TPA: ferrochelatase [Rhodothermales bacterium]
MTPRQFLRKYRYDRRLVTGQYYASDPLKVERGEQVGVVLLNLGGPTKAEDVAPFLYNLFMDPVIIDMPVSRTLRDWISRFVAKTRSRKVVRDYEVIGGGSPINRLTREQAQTLERHLNARYGTPAGVAFRTYIAMRYWHPTSEEAADRMKADGIDKVVLLPLYPHYSKTTTGSSQVYWWMLEQEKEIPAWPTTHVYEFAANPKYVQAISERIDEAIQRFPKEVRDDVHILFSAHGTPLREMKERRDPYCCLIHGTVDRVMAYRENDRPFSVSFQSKVGPAEWLTPSTIDKVQELAEQGVKALLVVPVAFVTDHIETAYELDVLVRQEADDAGLRHFEVTSGLNCHPLFIEALAEATVSQLELPVDVNVLRGGGNGDGSASDYPLRPLDQLPRFRSAERTVRCHQCEQITEARCWVQPRSLPEPVRSGQKLEK